MGNGGFVDPSSTDKTFSRTMNALGKISGLEESGGTEKDREAMVLIQLERHQMIGEKNDLEAGD